MSRTALTVWLLLPFVIVVALWFSIDRSKAQPKLDGIEPAGVPEPVVEPAKQVPAPAVTAKAPEQRWIGQPIVSDSDGGAKTLAYGRLERLRPPGMVAGVKPWVLEEGVLVWLPPGYKADSGQVRDYAVLYLAADVDRGTGYELFAEPSSEAEAEKRWGLDVSLGMSMAQRKLPLTVVVAVPAGASDDEFVRTLDALMPGVESAYAVSRMTGMRLIGGGGELGGRRALVGATRRPEMFGGVVSQSPGLFDEGREFFRTIAAAKTWPARVYVGIGAWDMGREDETDGRVFAGLNKQNTAMLEALGELLEGRGVKGEQRMLVVEPGAWSRASAWGRRMGEGVEFLLRRDNAMKRE